MSTLPPSQPAIRVFISHAAVDAKLAEAVADLLRVALKLGSGEIRCTSVDGYRLPGGADTDEQLKREVRDSPALVGILSNRSVQSPYVLIELGGRWLIDKHLLPLLAPGTPDAVIGGPLKGKNALRADNASQLHQMVAELAAVLHTSAEPAQSYHRYVEAIVSLGKREPSAVSSQPVAVSNSTAKPAQAPRAPAPALDALAVVQAIAQMRPIDVDLFLKKNGGAGATPGAWICARSKESKTLRAAVLTLYDVLFWSEQRKKFVEPREIHEHGPFTAIRLGSKDIFADTAEEELAFLLLDGPGALKIEGQRNGKRAFCRITTPGKWQLALTLQAPTGQAQASLCFAWDGGASVPKPVQCHESVVTLPPPPIPVRW